MPNLKQGSLAEHLPQEIDHPRLQWNRPPHGLYFTTFAPTFVPIVLPCDRPA